MKLIEDQINKFLNRKLSTKLATPNQNSINIYYRGQMSSMYKQEETRLNKIFIDQISPCDPESKVNLLIYYKSRKVGNLFIRNNPHPRPDSGVVYKYTCSSEACQRSQSYIGYTMCTLTERMRQHTQHGAIKSHTSNTHASKLTTEMAVTDTEILKRIPNKQELIITEALLIKEEDPPLNRQNEGEVRVLKIF